MNARDLMRREPKEKLPMKQMQPSNDSKINKRLCNRQMGNRRMWSPNWIQKVSGKDCGT